MTNKQPGMIFFSLSLLRHSGKCSVFILFWNGGIVMHMCVREIFGLNLNLYALMVDCVENREKARLLESFFVSCVLYSFDRSISK